MRLLLLVAVLLAGCGDGTGPGGVTAADLEGGWRIMFESQGDCFPAYEEPYPLFLFTPDNLTALSSGAVNIVGVWARAEARPFEWPATGTINIHDETVDLRFWWTDGLDGPRITLTGTLQAGPRIVGQWSEAHGSINYVDGCSGSFDGAPIR